MSPVPSTTVSISPEPVAVSDRDRSSAPWAGSLLDVDGRDLFESLSAASVTGTLRIGESSPVWVVFIDGSIGMAGQRGGTSLRATAGASGVWEPTDLGELSEGSAANDVHCATTLIDRFGSAAIEVVRAHVVTSVFGAMLPSSDRYVFSPSVPPPLPGQLRFDTSAVISDALDRVERWKRIAESIPSVSSVFRPRRRLAPSISEVTVSPEEWAVLVVLDGRRSVTQAISAVGRGAFDVCSILHDLMSRGLIERTN